MGLIVFFKAERERGENGTTDWATGRRTPGLCHYGNFMEVPVQGGRSLKTKFLFQEEWRKGNGNITKLNLIPPPPQV